MKNNVFDRFSEIFMSLILLAMLVTPVIVGLSMRHDRNKYGAETYEIVVTDMVVDSGILGKTKYRVSYNVRLTNRPKLETNMVWYSRTCKVDCFQYRKLTVGKHMYTHVSSPAYL